MKLGQAAMEALQAEITGRLQPGEELVAAGAVGLMGTEKICHSHRRFLRTYFSEGFLWEASQVRRRWGLWQEGESPRGTEIWRLAFDMGADCAFPLGEGGILAGLWKMAEASSVGLKADLRQIPIRQETIEICERFDVNPYYLLSDGAFLFGVRGGEILAAELRRRGLMAAVIGETNDSNDRLLYSGEHVRYLDRPGQDQLYRCPGFEQESK